MGTPRQLPHRILVSLQQRKRPGTRCTNVESTDDAIDARGGNDPVAVLVPIVGESFGRGEGGWGTVVADGGDRVRSISAGGVDSNLAYEMVGGGGGGAQIEDAQVGV